MSDYTGQQYGNYRLIRLLGRGGFAEVYEGEHVYLGTRAAIKILHARLAGSERASFLKEAQTIVRLEHEHIVRVLEFDVQGDTPFLVMEYAPGGTLRERFAKGKAVPPELVVPVVQQVASALQYAHEHRLVHRDVKPDNILLGAEQEILLSDFGIALLLRSTRKTSSMSEVVGTAAYMAPEQIRGRAQPASDQYALAIAVYEWLCGERPFRGTSFASLTCQHLLATPPPLRARAPHLPLAVEEVVQRALAKDPQQRFACVQDFALALGEAIGEPSISAQSGRYSAQSGRYAVGLYDTAALLQEKEQKQTVNQTPGIVGPISATVAAQPIVTQHVSTLAPPMRSERQGIRGRVTIVFGLLALLLVLGGVVVHFSPAQTSAIPVGQKSPFASLAQKQGEATYQRLYLQATSGTPIIEDPLTGPDSLDWLLADPKYCHFSAGALHLELTPQHNADFCSASNFTISDFAYQVQMTFNAGEVLKKETPTAGLVFRYSGTGTYFWDATVDGSCEFGAAKILGGLDYLIPRRACPALHTGYHQTNLLTVIARGSNIYLYVNKQFFGSYSDGTFTSGLVGMIAYDGAFDTSFQDARVWDLG
jgi:serine/threonine protein kinase